MRHNKLARLALVLGRALAVLFLGIVLLLFALDGLGTLVRRVAAWRAGWFHPTRGRRVLGRQPADAKAWPPESWRASGGPAG